MGPTRHLNHRIIQKSLLLTAPSCFHPFPDRLRKEEPFYLGRISMALNAFHHPFINYSHGGEINAKWFSIYLWIDVSP